MRTLIIYANNYKNSTTESADADALGNIRAGIHVSLSLHALTTLQCLAIPVPSECSRMRSYANSEAKQVLISWA